MDAPDRTPATYDLARAEYDYPQWDGPPRRTILICSHPRSGSTLLGEALTFAGGLGCPLEYFHAGFQPGFSHRWDASDIRAYVAAVWRHRTDPGGTLAVKLFWRDLVETAEALGGGPVRLRHSVYQDDPQTDAYRALGVLIATHFPRPVFVHLTRRDRIRQAVSGLAASQTARWRDIPGLAVREGYAAEAGYNFARIDDLLRYARTCDAHWERFFVANQVAPYRLVYEDLARDYQATMTPLLRTLGSKAVAPPPRMRRQADADTEAFVLQYLRDLQARGRASIS